MSLKDFIYDKPTRQPAILSRKRRAEKELTVSPSPEHSSPSSEQLMSCDDTPTTDTDMSSDENKSPNRKISPSIISQFRGIANSVLPFSIASRRASPLPELDWAEQKELWHSMVLKDMVYIRDNRVLKKHPELEPRMRAILLDWLTEVCEVYRLRRETFYLALDYIDRFLMAKPCVPRNCLQLLGATALFVASKMEEIYPPKLEQFAFVTDSACSEQDILTQELVLLMSLNWNLSPVTINCWLTIFLQLAFLEDGENLIGPEVFPRYLYINMTAVLDLCVLDIESLKYPYSILAASVVALFVSKETAMHVSGLPWTDLFSCVNWMKPFYEVTIECGGVDIRRFSDISSEDCHNIQTHSASLAYLDLVLAKQRNSHYECSPSSVLRELTPPQSNKKKRLDV